MAFQLSRKDKKLLSLSFKDGLNSILYEYEEFQKGNKNELQSLEKPVNPTFKVIAGEPAKRTCRKR